MAFLLILLEIYCYCEPILYFFRISPSPDMAFLAVHPAFWSVVFEIRNKNGKPEGLTIEEINSIVSSCYPELNRIDACLCYNELAGKLDSGKQLKNIEKDRL